jgi:hypothetical protein
VILAGLSAEGIRVGYQSGADEIADHLRSSFRQGGGESKIIQIG